MKNSEIKILIRLLQEIFKITEKFSIDLKDFYAKFLNSQQAYFLFEDYKYYYFNSYNVVYEFIEDNKVNTINVTYNENFIDYIGFIVAKFFETTNEEPKSILKYLPFDYLVENFDRFHLINENQVFYEAKMDFNLRNNILRKQRSSVNIDFTEYSNLKRLFFAKYIFDKLLFYPAISSAIFKHNRIDYFANNETFFTSINETELTDNFAAYKFDKIHTILAIFPTDNKQQHDEKLIKKIQEICFQNNPFTFVLIIRKRYVYFIENTDIHKLYFVYSTIDEKNLNKLFGAKFNN